MLKKGKTKDRPAANQLRASRKEMIKVKSKAVMVGTREDNRETYDGQGPAIA